MDRAISIFRHLPQTLRWLLLLGGAWVWIAAGGPDEARAASDETITVGSKTFTESVVLGELAVDLVESTQHEASHRRQLGGSRVLWKALRKGDIAIYPEYTGTIDQELFPDRELTSLDALREALAEEGIAMTEPLGFENTYVLGMKKSRARELGIEAISDLNEHPDLKLGFSNEFMDREDGWPGLSRRYNLPHEDVQGLDHDLAYRGLDEGDLDVIDLYSTDAEIAYYDIRKLEDDRDFFPSYRAVMLYRRDLEGRAPEVVEQLTRLEGEISGSEMISMNKAVKIDGRTEEWASASWLQRNLGIDAEIDRQTAWERFVQRSLEHLFMVVVSLSAAIALAVPLGIAAFRRRRLGQVILGLVGIVQTIPSLAMLVFMIPLFGIGTWPAIAALFLYSLLPIVRNTHAGLTDIPRDVRESAEVLGLTERAVLWRVELPIATRAILAGVKTSSVINIGIATLGALIGAGGYGQPILTGIRLDDMGLILQGAVPAALLAVAAQGVFELVERLIVPEGLRLDEPG